jgi:hypothetical protein
MGWNTSVLLAEGKPLAAMKRLVPDVFNVTEKTIDFEAAASASLDRDIAIGEINGWGVWFTPNLGATFFSEVLDGASQGGRAVVLVLNSVSTYYAFYLFAEGKQKRKLVRRDRKLLEEAGQPLPEETGLIWGDEESTLFELARRVTGLRLACWDTWERARFTLATLDL